MGRGNNTDFRSEHKALESLARAEHRTQFPSIVVTGSYNRKPRPQGSVSLYQLLRQCIQAKDPGSSWQAQVLPHSVLLVNHKAHISHDSFHSSFPRNFSIAPIHWPFYDILFCLIIIFTHDYKFLLKIILSFKNSFVKFLPLGLSFLA